MTTKEYNTPMLQVVSIKQSDILTTSPGYGLSTTETSGNLDAGRRFDDWDAGY